MIEIKKEKKLWNNYQTWDKTKAYKNSKLGEKDLTLRKLFFFTFLFLCQTTFKLQPIESHFFLSFSFCQSPLHIQRNFRWSTCPPWPPLAPPLIYILIFISIYSCHLQLKWMHEREWANRGFYRYISCNFRIKEWHAHLHKKI